MAIKSKTHPDLNHSENYLLMAFDGRNMKPLDHPDGHGIRTGDCGDTVEFFVEGNRNRIESIFFNVRGCVNTVACCNTVVHLATGLSAEAAWDIDPEQVIAFLETLDEAHYHCAELAVGAFYLALADMGSGLPGCYRK